MGDAGNYENVVLYDRSSCATPVEIRKSLLPKAGTPVVSKSSPKGFPGFCAGPRISFLSSWAFPLDLSETDATVLLHLPCFQVNMKAKKPTDDYLKTPCDFGIVFNATCDQLGLLVVTKNVPAAAYAAHSSVLRGNVLDAGAT